VETRARADAEGLRASRSVARVRLSHRRVDDAAV